MDEGEFRDDRERQRYQLKVEGGVAEALYNPVAGGVLVTEVHVPRALEGQGVGGRLAAAVVDDVKARGLVLLPVCPFLANWLRKHPEHAGVVHPDYRASLGI